MQTTGINTHISKVLIHNLALPFRMRFGHSAASRSVGDNIVLELELGNGMTGFGETLARPYVTGETPESVIDAVRNIFLPIIMEVHPSGFGEVIELMDKLPFTDGAKPLYAARCAVELAILDVYGKMFHRNPSVLTGWIDQPFWEIPGAANSATYSGVIGNVPPKKAAWMARIMRWWGISDFKIKVGDADEIARISAVEQVLSRGLRSGKVRIRVDVNSAWSENLREKIDQMEALGIIHVEQPTLREKDDLWVSIQHHSSVNLIADESLISLSDAERITKDYRAGIFNIRLAKNGGLLASLKLAAYAYSRGIEVQLGCMVGESAILTTAGQWFANLVPELIFAEGGYNRILLKDDISVKPVPLRFKGRLPSPKGFGLGVSVDRNKLEKYSISSPITIPL